MTVEVIEKMWSNWGGHLKVP